MKQNKSADTLCTLVLLCSPKRLSFNKLRGLYSKTKEGEYGSSAKTNNKTYNQAVTPHIKTKCKPASNRYA